MQNIYDIQPEEDESVRVSQEIETFADQSLHAVVIIQYFSI